MKLTYFGHSAFQIETAGATLLVDPFITGNKHAEGVVRVDDLEPTHVFLTHAHGDHWGDTPAIAGRTGAQVVANFEITNYIQQHHDHDNVQPMNTGGSWTFDFGRVTQTFARHSSSFPDGTYGGHPNGFIFEIEGHTIYALGDTDPFSEMAWYGEDFDIDVALMPVGDCFTMGPRGAARAAELLKPSLVVPIHYDTFPYIEIDMDAVTSALRGAGTEPRVLKPGETLTLE